jgi:hypothetical protein
MRGDLKDGDLLLYHVLPSDTLDIQRLISLGEQDGSKADFQYYHAGLVIDVVNDQGFEQNPPAMHYTKLSQEPWGRIDVYRPTVPIDVAKLRAWCASSLGSPYPYGQIAKFLAADAAAELTGLGVLEKLIDLPASGRSPHLDVCSATDADALDDASGGKMGWDRQDADMRPCDLTSGNVVLVVDGSAQA